MRTIEQRPRYAAGLGIAWAFLPALVVLSLAAGLGLAWILKLAYVRGWYILFLLPVFGGFALGGVLYLLVGWTRCRNRWAAGIVGMAAGLTGYLGYYELCLLDVVPPALAWRADLLPKYIEFRMQTDVAKEFGKPNLGPADRKPSEGANWYGFAVELVAVTGAAAWCAWSRACHAYCPALGQWMQREKTLLPAESCEALRSALEAGNLEDFVANTTPASDAQTAWRFTLEYAAPAEGSSLAYAVYASLDPPAAKGLWQLFSKLGRRSIRQVALDTGEVLALRPWFPKLAQLLASQHEELHDSPTSAVRQSAVEAATTDLAQITAVPEPYRQRVRSKGYALRVSFIGLVTGVYFFGGGVLAACGIWLGAEKGMPLGWAATAVGAVAFAWGGYRGLYCLGVGENRWINRRLRREISQRPDAAVDSRDSESRYVSLIPRESFAKVKLTMASDLLLLKIDQRGRRLILEGDCDRYHIPAGSIAVCEPQCFFHSIDTERHNELWMVRLVVAVQEGARELLLSVCHIRWTPPITNARRRQAAEDLCREINGLRA